jgi:periplasmic divalent cation tolerance protein
MSNLIVFYMLTSSQEKAQEIAQILLKKRLIACANYVQCSSSYWWQNTVQMGQEVIIVAKSRAALKDNVIAQVECLHPYQMPCIMYWPVEANEPFFSYVHDVTQQK